MAAGAAGVTGSATVVSGAASGAAVGAAVGAASSMVGRGASGSGVIGCNCSGTATSPVSGAPSPSGVTTSPVSGAPSPSGPGSCGPLGLGAPGLVSNISICAPVESLKNLFIFDFTFSGVLLRPAKVANCWRGVSSILPFFRFCSASTVWRTGSVGASSRTFPVIRLRTNALLGTPRRSKISFVIIFESRNI